MEEKVVSPNEVFGKVKGDLWNLCDDCREDVLQSKRSAKSYQKKKDKDESVKKTCSFVDHVLTYLAFAPHSLYLADVQLC